MSQTCDMRDRSLRQPIVFRSILSGVREFQYYRKEPESTLTSCTTTSKEGKNEYSTGLESNFLLVAPRSDFMRRLVIKCRRVWNESAIPAAEIPGAMPVSHYLSVVGCAAQLKSKSAAGNPAALG